MKRSRLRSKSTLKRKKRIKPKSGKRKLKQHLDLEIKQQALVRDAGKCMAPTSGLMYGKVQSMSHGGCLQAAHVYSKGRWPNLRHELDNIVTMCWRHHFFWAHKDPITFTDWFRETYPDRAIRLAAMKLL